MALLLPKDPDASAAALRDALQQHYGADLGVIITDSHNRAWRMGTIGSAIGCAGVTVLDDSRGGEDIYGRTTGNLSRVVQTPWQERPRS